MNRIRVGLFCFTSRTGAIALCGLATLSGCVGAPSAPVGAMSCDESMKAAFKPDSSTTVVAVKWFKTGDPLILTGVADARTPTAANDVCMVKLNVGPGNPGPTNAPSTSAGIGIEVWLPAKQNWNRRIHALGGGGWQGCQW